MLTDQQINRYRQDGYLFPIAALPTGELADCVAGLTRFERWLGKPVT